jgi:hypothetical protein
MKLTTLLQLAGMLHFGLVWAGATMPRAVDLRSHLAPLPPFIKRLFYVYYAFIGFVLAGFGIITFLYADALAKGEPLARAFAVFLVGFWTLRLIVAVFVFDVRPYLTNWFYRLGYQGTNLVFVYLVVVYAVVGWTGGRP